MRYNPDQSIRLKGYDYSQPEAYFVTLVNIIGNTYLEKL